MTRNRILLSLGSILLLAFVSGPAGAKVSVGDKAPPVEPSEWLNTKGATNWQSFRGRLILVEKWATWCGPCRTTIPHLNQLNQEFGKKGLVIIGVSDEAVGTIKPFMDELSMSYVVAVGGAKEYETPGIPHAWLVNPKGECVWEGHPANLKNNTIEEHIKDVRMTPEFKLPKELKTAQGLLDSGKYSQGMKDLDKYLAGKKVDETVGKTAKETIEQVKKMGEEQLTMAADLTKDKYYADAIQILATVEKGYSGHEIGNKAKTKKSELTGNPEVKLELAASQELERAKDLIKQKKFKPAADILRGISASKKLKDTKAKVIADKTLASIRDKV